MMSAPTRTAAPGIVTTPVADVATGLVFPDTTLLASSHVTPAVTKVNGEVSVKETAVPVMVAIRRVATAGVAVLVAVVVMFATVPVRFVSAKLKGPPKAPVVIF